MKNKLFFLLLLVSTMGLKAQTGTLSGSISSPFNDPVEVTTINLYDSNDNLLAVTSGDHFSFTGLTQGETYRVTFEKNEAPLNGVSTFDMVLIVRHILAIDPITSPYLLYAADVNSSTTVTVFDMVLLRRLILAIDSAMMVPSWQFLPAGITTFTGNLTLNEVEVEMTADEVTQDITGFKMGDINGTAIPD